ncbi:MAG: hypothetical protein J0I12_18470 [Candidatus Eremiobacteraeota bacterium]|nr:hypothetical protein [Candidatus Eremiobacteraeota bacterium]
MRNPFTASKLLLSALLLAPLSLPAFAAPVVYNVTADVQLGPASQTFNDNYVFNLLFGFEDPGSPGDYLGEEHRFYWDAPPTSSFGSLGSDSVTSLGNGAYRLAFQVTYDDAFSPSIFRLTQSSEGGNSVFVGAPGSPDEPDAIVTFTAGNPFSFVGGAYGVLFDSPTPADTRFTLNLQAVVAGSEGAPELDPSRGGVPMLFCGVLLGVLGRRRSG